MRRLLRSCLIVLFVLGPLSLIARADGAERRHPRPRQNREYRNSRDHDRRHYRQPYRRYDHWGGHRNLNYGYRDYRGYRHYHEPVCSYRVRGYYARDFYGRYWVPGHYVYRSCW